MIESDGASVTLMVADLERALAFYTGLLGFSVLYQAGAHFAMLERKGFQVGLHPWGAAGPEPRSRGVSIGLSVSNIEDAVGILESEGVPFPGGIVDDDGAILRADFKDPDGTALYLVQQRH